MFYRLRAAELLRLAAERGIPASGSAIAEAVGLTPPTVNRMLSGRPAHADSIALLTTELGCTVEQLFVIVESAVDRDARVARLLTERVAAQRDGGPPVRRDRRRAAIAGDAPSAAPSASTDGDEQVTRRRSS